jgi:F-type H+-transporting ATPase subunit b
MDLFKLEPGLFIWTWLTFGILLLLLSKLVFPALIAGIKQREKKIADSVDKAEEIERRLDAIEDEHRKMISDAQKEADAILRQIREEASELKKKLAKEADQKAVGILEDARGKIQEERTAILNSLRSDIAEMVCEASNKLINLKVSDDDDLKLAEKLVNEL